MRCSRVALSLLLATVAGVVIALGVADRRKAEAADAGIDRPAVVQSPQGADEQLAARLRRTGSHQAYYGWQSKCPCAPTELDCDTDVDRRQDADLQEHDADASDVADDESNQGDEYSSDYNEEPAENRYYAGEEEQVQDYRDYESEYLGDAEHAYRAAYSDERNEDDHASDYTPYEPDYEYEYGEEIKTTVEYGQDDYDSYEDGEDDSYEFDEYDSKYGEDYEDAYTTTDDAYEDEYSYEYSGDYDYQYGEVDDGPYDYYDAKVDYEYHEDSAGELDEVNAFEYEPAAEFEYEYDDQPTGQQEAVQRRDPLELWAWLPGELLMASDERILQTLEQAAEELPRMRRTLWLEYLERLGFEALELASEFQISTDTVVLELAGDPSGAAALLGIFRLVERGELEMHEAIELLERSLQNLPQKWLDGVNELTGQQTEQFEVVVMDRTAMDVFAGWASHSLEEVRITVNRFTRQIPGL